MASDDRVELPRISRSNLAGVCEPGAELAVPKRRTASPKAPTNQSAFLRSRLYPSSSSLVEPASPAAALKVTPRSARVANAASRPRIPCGDQWSPDKATGNAFRLP